MIANTALKWFCFNVKTSFYDDNSEHSISLHSHLHSSTIYQFYSFLSECFRYLLDLYHYWGKQTDCVPLSYIIQRSFGWDRVRIDLNNQVHEVNVQGSLWKIKVLCTLPESSLFLVCGWVTKRFKYMELPTWKFGRF